MEDWLKLSRTTSEDAALNIRFNWDEKPRRVINAQCPPDRWSSLDVDGAIDATLRIKTKDSEYSSPMGQVL